MGEEKLQSAEAALGPRLALANPNRMQQYTLTRDAAAHALADEPDPARRSEMLNYYNGLFNRYGTFAAQADAELMRMGPADPYFLAQHSRTQEANFWHQQPPHFAMEALRGEMLGTNLITGPFYDEKATRRSDSTLAGVKFSGFLGAGAGFFAADALGLGGTWKWIARIIGIFGGAAAGNMVASAINPPEVSPPPANMQPPQGFSPPLPATMPFLPANPAKPLGR